MGRRVETSGVEERLGEGGRKIILLVMESEEDREELMERKEEKRWRVNVEEDLTREEMRFK